MSVRKVTLDVDQYAEIRKEFRKLKSMDGRLAEMFIAICEEVAEREEAMWIQVFELAGLTEEDYKSGKYSIKIKWVTRELEVTETKDD